MQAESIMAGANIAAAILAGGIGVMEVFPDLNRETLLKAYTSGPLAAIAALGIDQARGPDQGGAAVGHSPRRARPHVGRLIWHTANSASPNFALGRPLALLLLRRASGR
jgi:hypothetical protein